MREVDLELDYCPKCEPEETQDPFPAQEHCFFNSFATVVQCTKCGTALCSIAQIGSDHHAKLLFVVLGEFLLGQ